MRIEYDKEADAAYIYLKFPMEKGEAVKTIELNENIILDFDSENKLIGIEVLNAKEVLSESSLMQAGN